MEIVRHLSLSPTTSISLLRKSLSCIKDVEILNIFTKMENQHPSQLLLFRNRKRDKGHRMVHDNRLPSVNGIDGYNENEKEFSTQVTLIQVTPISHQKKSGL